MDTTDANLSDDAGTSSEDTQLRSTIRLGQILAICLLLLAVVCALFIFRNPTPLLGGTMQTFLCAGMVGSVAFMALRRLRARVVKLEDEMRKLQQELLSLRQNPNDRNA